MCDKDFVMCDVPKAALDMVMVAWKDFKDNPDDGLKFNAFDWAVRVAIAKWETYAGIRRANSA